MENNIIKKIIVSEKSFKRAANKQYTFLVDKKANKLTIAKQCQELFGVKVLSVNTINMLGKEKMTKRVKGKRSDTKNAIVTVDKNDKIDLFEIEEKDKDKDKDKKVKTKESKETKKNDKSAVDITIKKK